MTEKNTDKPVVRWRRISADDKEIIHPGTQDDWWFLTKEGRPLLFSNPGRFLNDWEHYENHLLKVVNAFNTRHPHPIVCR